MSTLKVYEVISGLRVNTEKTKVIKIGGWRDSRTILCQNMNLEWSQKFTSLGILYDINNFSKITDQNIDGKIKEIQKLIFIWNGRYLTPYGKIIIIKSLLISKITHVLLSLPSPSPFTINKLEKIFQEFIWGQKNPKFRKEVMENALNLGGLKMTNLCTFDSALKLSWLKRIINQNDGWAEFPQEFNIHNIFKYGDNYTKILLSKIKNDFWKDIILSVQKLEKVCNISNHAQLKTNISRHCKISDIDKIFGQASNGDIINKIITATKAIIYNNRKTGKKHKLNDIKRLLFHQFRTEEYEATLSQNEEFFFDTWGNIYIELITLYSA